MGNNPSKKPKNPPSDIPTNSSTTTTTSATTTPTSTTKTNITTNNTTNNDSKTNNTPPTTTTTTTNTTTTTTNKSKKGNELESLFEKYQQIDEHAGEDEAHSNYVGVCKKKFIYFFFLNEIKTINRHNKFTIIFF